MRPLFNGSHDLAQARPRRPSNPALLARLRSLHAEGALELPLPGHGNSTELYARLMVFGSQDLSLARVIEAHTDAIAILSEAARPMDAAALYGVWACDAPNSRLELVQDPSGWILSGCKRYCTGATFLDRALVTAHDGDELVLVDIALDASEIRIDTSEWKSPAFAATDTARVDFDRLPIEPSQIFGRANWYLDRPGFWHGAISPAACWAGGAMGLIQAARKSTRTDSLSLAHLGTLEAHAWGLAALLSQAAREVDADPKDMGADSRGRALCVRQLIERGCMDVMDHFGRLTGPSLLAYSQSIVQRHAELTVYLRQCHAERDLELIARCRHSGSV